MCSVFPNKKGEYQLPAPPRVFHKWRIPPVMFLAVCARPRKEYTFDGKIVLWSFSLGRPAERSDVRTGAAVGQTMVLEDVSVTAVEYRMKIVVKDILLDSMRKSMWWFNKAARNEVVGGVCVPCWKHVRGKWQFNKRKGNEMPRGRHATALLTPWCQATHSSCQPESLRVPRQDETVQPQCCYSARAEP